MKLFKKDIYTDINEGLKLLEQNPESLLVDVRENKEYITGHIPGSINIPLLDIEDVYDYVDDIESPILLYCLTGNRSSQAMSTLKEFGYENAISIGGINKYKGKLE